MSRRLQDTKMPKPLIFKMAHDIFFEKTSVSTGRHAFASKEKSILLLGAGSSIDHEHYSPHQSNLGVTSHS